MQQAKFTAVIQVELRNPDDKVQFQTNLHLYNHPTPENPNPLKPTVQDATTLLVNAVVSGGGLRQPLQDDGSALVFYPYERIVSMKVNVQEKLIEEVQASLPADLRRGGFSVMPGGKQR